MADEAGRVLAGERTESQDAFNLAPITLDRPFYYAILRLTQLPTILQRLEILPQAEVGQLVNLAVLAQAAVIALIVLAVPLFAPRVAGQRSGRPAMLRPILYFASLGLGFLFIEIFLIEKASLYLNDRTSAFALVLTGMLVFSGLGSLLAGPGAPGRHRAVGGGGDGLVRAGAAGAAAVPAGDPWAALAAAGGGRGGAGGAGVAGAGHAVPARPGAGRHGGGRVPALGLGAERRVLRRRHAAGQSFWRCNTASTGFC